MAAAGGFGQWRGAAAGAAASLLVTWLLSQPQQVAADRLAAHYLLPYLSDSPPSSAFAEHCVGIMPPLASAHVQDKWFPVCT